MANKDHLNIIEKGVDTWNQWRREIISTNIEPDLTNVNLEYADLTNANLKNTNLSNANLSGLNLTGVSLNNVYGEKANFSRTNLKGVEFYHSNFSDADFSNVIIDNVESYDDNYEDAIFIRANFNKAKFIGVNLSNADLSKTNLSETIFQNVNLSQANLTGANISKADHRGTVFGDAELRLANYRETDLRGADLDLTDSNIHYSNLSKVKLKQANLTNAHLIKTDLKEANLMDCSIYGISAWGLDLERANQSNLIITDLGEITITVDNLEVAQFIYLLISSEKIRHVIDTIVSKVVLIIGRFTPERKIILDAIRDELRKHDYLPIVFDFDKPSNRDTQETVTTLASLAKFIIADITDPRSIPQELVSIVKMLPSVPVQTILENGFEPWGMYDHIKRFSSVLNLYIYDDLETLLKSLEKNIIPLAEAKSIELTS